MLSRICIKSLTNCSIVQFFLGTIINFLVSMQYKLWWLFERTFFNDKWSTDIAFNAALWKKQLVFGYLWIIQANVAPAKPCLLINSGIIVSHRVNFFNKSRTQFSLVAFATPLGLALLVAIWSRKPSTIPDPEQLTLVRDITEEWKGEYSTLKISVI